MFQCAVYTEVNVSLSKETKEKIDFYLSQYYIGNKKDTFHFTFCEQDCDNLHMVTYKRICRFALAFFEGDILFIRKTKG